MNKPDPNIDTLPSLTGKELERQLKAVGYSAKYAKEHGQAFDKMLKEEQIEL